MAFPFRIRNIACGDPVRMFLAGEKDPFAGRMPEVFLCHADARLFSRISDTSLGAAEAAIPVLFPIVMEIYLSALLSRRVLERSAFRDRVRPYGANGRRRRFFVISFGLSPAIITLRAVLVLFCMYRFAKDPRRYHERLFCFFCQTVCAALVGGARGPDPDRFAVRVDPLPGGSAALFSVLKFSVNML